MDQSEPQNYSSNRNETYEAQNLPCISILCMTSLNISFTVSYLILMINNLQR